MFPWLAKLGIGDLGDLFTKIVGTFKLPPEKAAELTALKENNAAELQKLAMQMEEHAADAITKEVDAASANIRAEAQTGDKYTSRARPTFLYVCNFILICNYIMFPIIGRRPLDFPEPLFWLFGSVMLGYVGARSWEKVSGIKANA